MPKPFMSADHTPGLVLSGGTIVGNIADVPDDADAEAGRHLTAMTRD